jgi:hypothetical protein
MSKLAPGKLVIKSALLFMVVVVITVGAGVVDKSDCGATLIPVCVL